MFKSIFVFVLAILACRPALAAEHGRHMVLRPERHVIELVRPPYSGSFIINGGNFPQNRRRAQVGRPASG
jgi:hypothetical protein